MLCGRGLSLAQSSLPIHNMWVECGLYLLPTLYKIIIIIGLSVLAVALAGKAGGVANVMNNIEPESLKFFRCGFQRDRCISRGMVCPWPRLNPSQDVFSTRYVSSSAKTAVYSSYCRRSLSDYCNALRCLSASVSNRYIQRNL